MLRALGLAGKGFAVLLGLLLLPYVILILREFMYPCDVVTSEVTQIPDSDWSLAHELRSCTAFDGSYRVIARNARDNRVVEVIDFGARFRVDGPGDVSIWLLEESRPQVRLDSFGDVRVHYKLRHGDTYDE